MSIIKRTERGWAGHFICAAACLFRRNTLLQKDDLNIIVSSVGDMRLEGKRQEIGYNRLYETFIFVGCQYGVYLDADVRRQIFLDEVRGCISTSMHYDGGLDNLANEIHEENVNEVVRLMESGEIEKFLSAEEEGKE